MGCDQPPQLPVPFHIGSTVPAQVVVFEIDWAKLTGFDYYNPLTHSGRLALETGQVRACLEAYELVV
jgi:hypothetical protein